MTAARTFRFAENLAAIRRLRGLNQVAFAELAGVGQSTISKWEQGSQMPDVESLPQIADRLGFTIEELLFANLGGGRFEAEGQSAPKVTRIVIAHHALSLVFGDGFVDIVSSQEANGSGSIVSIRVIAEDVAPLAKALLSGGEPS